jgi:mono/diheme cytochrome c family protein
MNRILAATGVALSASVWLAANADAQSVERGKYLVERVGMCNDCHTPRDAKGGLIVAENLKGAPIGFRPLATMPWADHAPPIAGLPASWTPAQMAHFLQTGKRPDGSSPRPPMPEYRLSRDDAWSVTDYLRRLK